MFRYTVPVDDTPWAYYLTSNPVHVANGISLAEVEFWAEDDGDVPSVRRLFQVFGTGHLLPENARWVGTCPRTREGLVWHLYELVSDKES